MPVGRGTAAQVGRGTAALEGVAHAGAAVALADGEEVGRGTAALAARSAKPVSATPQPASRTSTFGRLRFTKPSVGRRAICRV
jgi:hypothetical protein